MITHPRLKDAEHLERLIVELGWDGPSEGGAAGREGLIFHVLPQNGPGEAVIGTLRGVMD